MFFVVNPRGFFLGTTDVVPGVFHVKTLFGWRCGMCGESLTYLILAGEADRAFEIPSTSESRQRSITVAWIRWTGALGMVLSIRIPYEDGVEDDIEILIYFFIFLVSGMVYLSSLCFYYASYERATELCSHLGELEPLYKSKVNQYFSRGNRVVEAEAVPMDDPDDEEGFHDEEIEIPEVSPTPSDEKIEDLVPIATEIV